jgi:hypothetical protein
MKQKPGDDAKRAKEERKITKEKSKIAKESKTTEENKSANAQGECICICPVHRRCKERVVPEGKYHVTGP